MPQHRRWSGPVTHNCTPIMPLTCDNRGAGEAGPGYFHHLCGSVAQGPSTHERRVRGVPDVG
jgi:hypothetical protein